MGVMACNTVCGSGALAAITGAKTNRSVFRTIIFSSPSGKKNRAMKILFKPLASAVLLSLAAACASRPPEGAAAPGAQATAGKGVAVTGELYGQPGQYPGTGTETTYASGGGAGSVGRVVYFDFDSSEIRADADPVITANARYLAANPAVNATLEGHTDERGTREYNIGLGERRAESVRRAMSAYGVSSGQMRTLSYGEERPADPGHTEESYAKNRRVEIVY
jgi:peptidoglycan-associated lipoprotein